LNDASYDVKILPFFRKAGKSVRPFTPGSGRFTPGSRDRGPGGDAYDYFCHTTKNAIMDVRTFINRPILSGVISVAIVIVGLIGLSRLPIEQFPDIAPPTVRVSATYTGANAETVMKSVVTPLEEQLNGVENMIYMTSTATNTGVATINVYFRQGTDPDMSVVNVQNRVASAQGLLPAEVTKAGVTVRKRQNNSLKAISLYSPDDRYDANFLTNYMKINIEPRMSRIAGVGEVNIWGASYSLRIWLDPSKMAQYGLMPSDIAAVLAEQNVESPTGTLGAESANTFQYVLKYRGRYEEEADYFYEDTSDRIMDDDVLARLLSFNNVIVTSHQGFFTREALDNIAHTTLQNISDFSEHRELVNEVRVEPENAVVK